MSGPTPGKTLAIADDYIVTRRGFLRRKYQTASPRTIYKPVSCQVVASSHLVWPTGDLPGIVDGIRTLNLRPAICDHTLAWNRTPKHQPAVDVGGEQLVLF